MLYNKLSLKYAPAKNYSYNFDKILALFSHSYNVHPK